MALRLTLRIVNSSVPGEFGASHGMAFRFHEALKAGFFTAAAVDDCLDDSPSV